MKRRSLLKGLGLGVAAAIAHPIVTAHNLLIQKSDNTSIWLIAWGEDSVETITPKAFECEFKGLADRYAAIDASNSDLFVGLK